MLLRSDRAGVLAIGQPSHAWISGQLARAWGNAPFGALEPHEEVCLAAEQHDVGMAAWDLAPTRNPETGLPHSFIEMPISAHMELWRAGPRRLLSQSRYAALLVSMHGSRLYKRRDLAKLAARDADAVREFLREQRSFQEALLATLRDDPATAPAATAETVARNSRLLWTWDSMSLALCLDWAPWTACEVPTVDGVLDVHIRADAPLRLTIDPWPFRAGTLTVRCEGRRLGGRYETNAALAQALAAAPWQTLDFHLRPS